MAPNENYKDGFTSHYQIARDLNDLREVIREKYRKSYTFFNGIVWYGDVFELRVPRSGDKGCSCDLPDREEEWKKRNSHRDHCCEAIFKRKCEEAGIGDGDLYSKNREETRRRVELYGAIRDETLSICGIEYLDCNCDWTGRNEAWTRSQRHLADCDAATPGFRHFRSGISIWFGVPPVGHSGWHIFEEKPVDWASVLAECIQEVKDAAAYKAPIEEISWSGIE